MIIPKFSFPFYVTILIISGIVSIMYIYFSLYKEKIRDKNIYLYILLYFSFAFVFAKFYTIFSKSFSVDFFSAGLSSYGGFIGIVISSIIFEKILPLNKKLIKYVLLSIPLTYGISKIACFVVGCCHGIPYNGMFSVIYENRLNIPLFPIQIIESFVFLLIFFLLNKWKDKINDFCYVIIIFALSKFLLDFFRYDHISKILTFNQLVSLFIIIISSLVCFYKKNK